MRNLRQLLRRSGLLSNEKRPRRSVKSRRSESTQRRLGNEVLEKRELLAGDLGFAPQHNYWNGFDVNDDGAITSRDALAIINQLGRQNGGESEMVSDSGTTMFYDVNADREVTASDALSVINALGRGEEVGELIELMLNARTTEDTLIAPDANGVVTVDVGQIFDLEVTYDDLRLFNNRLGAFQLFTDIETFDLQGNRVTGVISPVLNETQRIIIDESLTNGSVASTGVTFSIPELPPNAPAGSELTYFSPINDFGNNSRGELTNALTTFGYTTDQFTIDSLSFDNNDLGFQVHFSDDAFGNVDLPNISVDVNETNAADNVPTTVQEFAPFLADGVTPNSDAVQFNINAFSRTFNNNEEYYSSLNRGQFDPAVGFTDIGGLASQVPLQGGGIQDVTDDGNFIEPFDAFSIRLSINQPVQGLVLQLSPGEDREATLLYGRDEFVPQDMVLIEEVDSNNNGIGRVVINAGVVVAEPGTFSIAPASVNVNEAAGTATFTVNRSGGSTGAVSVDFATANGTASAGEDYTANSGTLNFADGQTSQTITVAVIDDTEVEGNETFTVTLSNPTGGTALEGVISSTATIVDNDNVDPVPGTLSITPATLQVNEGAGTATFTVNRTGGSDGAVAVNFTTVNGTAIAGQDFTAASGTLNFAAGETSMMIVVSITDDMDVESAENFTVVLSNPTGNASLGTTTSTATIVDNDVASAPGTFSIAPPTLSVGESAGTATFTVNRTGGSDGVATVDFTTVNGTATAGQDFVANSGTLTFADGQTAQSITVMINNDTVGEGDETFSVAISNPTSGASLGTVTSSTVTILDDDVINTPGVLSITPANVSVNEGAGTATFTVNRTGGTLGPVSVDFATANGTATAGQDFTANSGTLNFADGQSSQTITVSIIDDVTDEPNETFTVTISNATGGATLGANLVSTATIVDNDAAPMNNPPVVAGPVTATFAETAAVSMVDLLSGASDPDNDTLTISTPAITGNQAGISVNGSMVTVTPSAYTSLLQGQVSTIQFSYNVLDGQGGSTPQTATITITGVNTPPVANNDVANAFTGGTTIIAVLANDNAGGGETQALSVIAASSSQGVTTINSDNTISFTPNAGFLGNATISYTIQDAGGLQDTATVAVNVQDFIPSNIRGDVFIDNTVTLDSAGNISPAEGIGVMNEGESGLAGILVRLVDSNGTTIASVLTDINGGYEFINVAPGNYSINYDVPDTVLVTGGTSSVINIDASSGGGDVVGPNLAALGTQGAAIETMDILVSSYLRTNTEISNLSGQGREGGLVSLDDGQQQFLIVGEGFDSVSNMEFVLSDSGDSAILLIMEENDNNEAVTLIAELDSEDFVFNGDLDGISGVQFFGGREDFTFSAPGGMSSDLSEFQDAIDNFMSNF